MEETEFMKSYLKPNITITYLVLDQHILGLSGAGKEFDSDDVTYSKETVVDIDYATETSSPWAGDEEEE